MPTNERHLLSLIRDGLAVDKPRTRKPRARSTTYHAPSPTARRLEAYAALGVTPEAVYSSPKITPELKAMGHDMPFYIQLLRSSPIPEARAFMAHYDAPRISGRHREVLPIEAFCISARMCPSRLLEVILAALMKRQQILAATIAADSLPDVVRASIQVAQMPQGVEDRMAQLKHAGFLPLPKGSQVEVNVLATSQSHSEAQTAVATFPAPPPEDTIRRLTNRFNDDRKTIQGNAPPLELTEGVTESVPHDIYTPTYEEEEA